MSFRVKLSRISTFVNCWKVQINSSRVFAVMPAHVAVYKENNKWRKSIFLNKCDKNLIKKCNWKVPFQWSTNFDPHNDFAWTEIDNNNCEGTVLKKSMCDIDNPMDVSFYFSHTIDHNGKICSMATFGKINGTIYKSPCSNLLEAPGIGFRGMSGAIATDRYGDCVGMLLRRGSNLGETKFDGINSEYKFSNNLTSLRRSLIMPFDLMSAHIKNNNSINIDDLINKD